MYDFKRNIDLSVLKEIDHFLWLNQIVYSDKFISSIQDAYIRRNNKCMDYDGLCNHLMSYCTTITQKDYEKKYINTQSKVNDNKVNQTSIKKPTDKELTKKFLDFFNGLLLSKKGQLGRFSTLSKTDLNNLKKLKESYTDHEDWIKAFSCMIESQWVVENNMATPAHYLRNDSFQKYLNAYVEKPKFRAPWS